MNMRQKFLSFFGWVDDGEMPSHPKKKTVYIITIGDRKIIATRYWVYPASGVLGWATSDGGIGSTNSPYFVESVTEDAQ